MGGQNPPLSSISSLLEIMNKASNKGLLHLDDICLWDRLGNWVGWFIPDLPVRLQAQNHLLLLSLSGMAPVHSSLKDSWGWGKDGVYSAAKGFSVLQSPQSSNFPPIIWKSI